MPVTYRTDVRRHYHQFVQQGMERYAGHRATQAGLRLASELLGGSLDEAAAAPNACSMHTERARAFRLLRDHGVTPAQLLARLAEVVCFTEDHPERIPNQKFEDHMLARAMLTLVPWKIRFRPGAKLLRHTGAMLREHLYPWALAFVRKLRSDINETHALIKASISFE
jgi:hypothetical protein